MSLPTITLEEHFLSKSIREGHEINARYSSMGDQVVKGLLDLSEGRISAMDAGHVSLQIVSHTPGGSSVEPSICSAANDELAAAIRQRPDRLAGFANLPMARPDEAAAELERCVEDLGFVGALVDSHTEAGEFYDAERFWVVFAKAQELDVPIYLHPAFPTPEMTKVFYQGNYSQSATALLGGAGIGWHQGVALHIMRLYAAGVFDRFPKLKIIIGHSGEMLPFQLERSNMISKRFGGAPPSSGSAAKSLTDVWNENIWITTSGMFSLNPMATLLRNTKIDRIMYSVDWPFSQNEWGWEFLQELKHSGMLKDGELEMIAYKNAEKLLGVKATK